jgi:hypothetical protein
MKSKRKQKAFSPLSASPPTCSSIMQPFDLELGTWPVLAFAFPFRLVKLLIPTYALVLASGTDTQTPCNYALGVFHRKEKKIWILGVTCSSTFLLRKTQK